MKIKIIALSLILSLGTMCFSACGTEKNIQKEDFLYEMYVNTSGAMQYVKIFSLEKDNINYSQKDLREDKNFKEILHSIGDAKGDIVYGTVYRKSRQEGLENKVLIFKNGSLDKKLRLNGHGPSNIISDVEKDLAYVSFVLQPASYNPQGRPYKILKAGKEYKDFALKGFCEAYAIGPKYIYVSVSAVHLGYKETPDKYLAKIDRETQEVTIINEEIDLAGSMAYNPINKKIYAITYTGGNEDQLGVSKYDLYIYRYDEDGNLEEKSILDSPHLNDIHISDDGSAYVTAGNHMYLDDPNNYVAKMDLETMKIIKKIDLPKTPCVMTQKDNYLFICDRNGDAVSIVDTNTFELIGNISNLTNGRLAIDGVVVKKNPNL